MCKFTVAYLDRIGSRPVGWCLFNGKDYGFFSDKQVKAKLQQGILVNGLKLDKENTVVIDTDFTTNLMAKSGLTFQPLLAPDGDEASIIHKYYALVQVEKTEKETLYTFITNKCGYEVFSEQKVKTTLAFAELGGVRLDEAGNIVVHQGVTAAKASQSEPEKDSKPKVEEAKPKIQKGVL